jgi:RimJ/RimL family protein N-acetyltransferase
MLPIETKRLTLRPLQLEDARVVANLVGNWNVVRWLAMPPFPYTMADAEAFIVDTLTRAPECTGTVGAIARDGQLLGIVGIEPRDRGPTLGFWLGEPFWGNGYMSEAASALVRAFFSHTTAPDLQSGYLDGNLASARIHEKLGFVVTGHGLQSSRSNGRDMPDITLLLTRERYRTLNP